MNQKIETGKKKKQTFKTRWLKQQNETAWRKDSWAANQKCLYLPIPLQGVCWGGSLLLQNFKSCRAQNFFALPGEWWLASDPSCKRKASELYSLSPRSYSFLLLIICFPNVLFQNQAFFALLRYGGKIWTLEESSDEWVEADSGGEKHPDPKCQLKFLGGFCEDGKVN